MTTLVRTAGEWQVYLDAASGKEFYSNPTTGAVQWDEPTPPTPVVAPPPPLPPAPIQPATPASTSAAPVTPTVTVPTGEAKKARAVRIYTKEKEWVTISIDTTTTVENVKSILENKKKIQISFVDQLHILIAKDAETIVESMGNDKLIWAELKKAEAIDPSCRMTFDQNNIKRFTAKNRRNSITMCIPQLHEVDKQVLMQLSRDLKLDKKLEQKREGDKKTASHSNSSRGSQLLSVPSLPTITDSPAGSRPGTPPSNTRSLSTAADADEKDGPNYWFTDVLEGSVMCFSCNTPLYNPVMAKCGHCIHEMCKNSASNCPICFVLTQPADWRPCYGLQDLIGSLHERSSTYSEIEENKKQDVIKDASSSRQRTQNSLNAKAALAIETIVNKVNSLSDKGYFTTYLTQNNLYPDISGTKQKEKKHEVYSKVHAIVQAALLELNFSFETISYDPCTLKRYPHFDPQHFRYIVKWG